MDRCTRRHGLQRLHARFRGYLWGISQPVAEVSAEDATDAVREGGSVRTPDRRLVTARYRFLEGSDRT
jgi:hypothetical protein